MASTSATSGPIESEPATISQGVAQSSSSSSSSPSSSRSLFSCCLDWLSVFPSWRSMESSSMASSLDTTVCIPQNEPFQDMAPSQSSTGRYSTLNQKPSYDVFINHRGPDVKKNLATRIYDILVNMKLKAFLDSEELEYGDFLPTTLETTIRGATLHIAIFSKRYAESAWCLEELSLMLRSGAKIIPIFYQVEPADLRYVAQRKGLYVGAFNKHEKRGRYKPEKLKDWKDALHKVSFNIGEIIKNNDDEMRLFKNIVNIVLKEIRNVPLTVAKHSVGLNEIVKDFENTVQLGDGNHGIQIVGIWGMGGCGKTTLAKELYNRRSSSMERSSFIFDIREAKDVLHKKQIQLLKDFGVNETFDSVNQGKEILGRHLRAFRVLIVLDDVDHANQLDALLSAKNNFGKGSLIIVTTREHQVLTSWGIDSVYKMRGLDQINAEKLFCWNAFLQPSPLNGFEELVKNFLKVCDGLPLSLKVFGAQLYGNSSKQFWKSLFHKISRILPEDIKERLKISYDALDHEEKEAFLDSACFFIGREHSVAIEVWEGSRWSGLYTWERLFNKCLVELDKDNCIIMHDHLRDLGREIANCHSPSRLWSSQQIVNYGKQIEKMKDIRGIEIVPSGKEEQLSYREASTPYLAGLKLLMIKGDYFNQIIGEVSTELLWLRWSDIGQRNLPPRLSLKKLRVLEISESRRHHREDHHFEELWEAESNAPVQLRELIISGCIKFERLPNSIGCLHELRKIVINWSNYIMSLPESFCLLQQLEHLDLADCQLLSSLPSRFGDLTNLRYLDLSRCRNLKNLPISFKSLILLQYLNLSNCKELKFMSDDFQNIRKLEFLSLHKCLQLEELPRHITNQASLRKLNLMGVKRLRELPIEIGQLGRLQKLDIDSDLLISLPNSFGDLSSLSQLTIRCLNLESLPNSLGDLSSLTYLLIDCSNLKSLPNSFGDLSSLTRLSINSPNLRRLPFSVACLSLLEHLEIGRCPISQIDFGKVSSSYPLSNLKQVKLIATKVCRISISEDRYLRLESLDLQSNVHLTKIEALPASLECLHIGGSPKLVVLPSFARLTSLRELEVRGCGRIQKVEGLKHCTGMEKLCLQTCGEEVGRESLERMEKLRKVQLGANKGSAIISCIQRIKRWPDKITICTRAVSNASSLLSPNVFVVESPLFSVNSGTPFTFSETMEPLLNDSSNGNAIMFCFIINCVYPSQVEFRINILETTYIGFDEICSMEIGEGRWAVIGIFTPRCTWLSTKVRVATRRQEGGEWVRVEVEFERRLAVRGEKQRLVEAFLPLLQSISC